MPDPANPNQNPPAPDPKPTPPAPANPPPAPQQAPAPPQPTQQPTKGEAPAYLTVEQQEQREQALRQTLREELKAELVKEWVPIIEEKIRGPIRRDGKIRALRQELQGAGKYLPADDDATDPTSPGDLAALCDLDDSAAVHMTKDGKALTKLDIELGRVRARLLKRKATHQNSDALPTPGVDGADAGNFYDSIRKQTQDEVAARNRRQDLAQMPGALNPVR